MKETSIGLKQGTVKVVPYNPVWAQMFEEEKQSLEEMFDNRILGVEHVGSTAVPGLLAKPILDINVAILSLTDVQDFIEKLPKLGYQYLPNRSYPVPEYSYRHFFVKGPEQNRTHYLKLIESHDKQLKGSILFRNYLRTNNIERDKYAVLKQKLAEKYANDRTSYTESKAEFIQDIVRRARQKVDKISQ